jgi:hypothetical protein
MEIFSLFLNIFLLAPLAILIVALAGCYFFWFRKSSALKCSLGFVLYEVSMPRAKKEEGKDFKSIIAKMEQFYAGMSEFKPYFVLELVSPATQDETNFYAAIPRSQASFFEKQLHSVFPEAEIREEKSDYNIFKFRSPNIGAVLELKESHVLPIKTYEELNTDPLEVLGNTFSTLERKKEGAAVQIIIDPHAGNYKQNIEKSIKLLQAGEPLKTALRGGESLFASLLRVLTGGKIHEEKREESGFIGAKQELQQEVIGLLNKKNARQIMAVNIRLIVSAQTRERSQAILDEMKSAFSQFNDPRSNAFFARDLKGRALKNLFHDFSFRLLNRRNILYLNTAELTSIFHFPVYEIFAPKLKYLRLKRVEPPVNLVKTGILIGKNSFRGKQTEVRIGKEDRRRHFYVVGQTGTGKSVLMKNMILQDIREGNGICFIDPHGDSVEEILGQIPSERWEDVVYFDPADVARPLGLNILDYDQTRPEQKTFVVNELLEIFNKLYDMSTAGGPMFEQYFRNAALLVMEHPESGNTLLEISRVLSDSDFRHFKLSKSKNPVVNKFWTEVAEKAGGESAVQNMVPYITSKFDTFLANEIMRPILCQQKSTLDFRQAMDGGKIMLINLSKGRLGELNAYLLGMLIVGKLFMASMGRADIPEDQRRDFYFYIDEFQNVTTNSIAVILSEARKYRLNLVISHQFIGQLQEEIKKAVFGNVGSLASFRVGEEDAEFLEQYFEPVFSKENLMNIANHHAYVKLLINGETSRPFNIETYPPEKGRKEVADKVKEISAIKYGRSLREVESEINRRYLKSVSE